MAVATHPELGTRLSAPPSAPPRLKAPPPADTSDTPEDALAEQIPATTATAAAAAAAAAAATATRSLLVILHGKRVEDDLLRNALQQAKEQGHQLSVRVTFDRGDVDHFVSEAVRLNDTGATRYQTIVAGGGDGTLNEVVSALMHHREAIQRQGLAVALIPLGTANDFARTTGISVDPQEALRLALNPALIRPIDVALVNGRPFLNVAVAGGLAEVPPDELSSKWKRLLGPVAIAFYVLKRLTSKRVLQPHAGTTFSFNPHPAQPAQQQQQQQQELQLQQPDHSSTRQQQNGGMSQQQQQQQIHQMLEFQSDLLMLVAGNSRQMGGTLAVCPDALLDDGLLDFTLLTGSSLATQAAALVSALASREDHDSALDSGICQLRASRLEVHAAAGSSSSSTAAGAAGAAGDVGSSSSGGGDGVDVIPVNRDGEPEPASNRLVFEVLHRVLPMHLPDERLLLSGQPTSTAGGARCSSSSRISSSGGNNSSSGSNRAAPRSSSGRFIKGSIKHPDQDSFIPAATAVPGAGASSAAAGEEDLAAGKGGSRPRRRQHHHRHRHQGLTVKTLRRMLVVAGPEGNEVRRRAALAAAARKLCLSLSVVLLGGVLGWAFGSRAAKARQQQQQRREDEMRRQEAAAAAAALKTQRQHRGWHQRGIGAPAAAVV